MPDVRFLSYMGHSVANMMGRLKSAGVSMLIVLSLTSPSAKCIGGMTLPEEGRHYLSEDGGFEVDYPEGWSVSAESTGASVGVAFKSPAGRDGDETLSAAVGVRSTPLNEPGGGCKRRDSHLSEGYKDKVVSSKEIVVDGMKAERVETESRIDRDIIIYVQFSSGDRTFCVAGDFPRAYNLDRFAPAYDEMLKSFRLLPAAKPGKGMNRTRNKRASHPKA